MEQELMTLTKRLLQSLDSGTLLSGLLVACIYLVSRFGKSTVKIELACGKFASLSNIMFICKAFAQTILGKPV